MALPRINESPKHKLKVPSTGKEVFFRPFYVKEQKVLLMAMEAQDQELILKAMVDTIVSCVEDRIDPNALSTFDVEYMFTKIRAKSVGETADIFLECTECKHKNEIHLNLDIVEMDVPTKIPEIQLNDKYTLVMRFPRYNSMLESFKGKEKLTFTDLMFNMALGSLDKLLTEDEAISFDEESIEEKVQFLDNLNSDQFGKIMEFVQSLPKLEHDIDFTCESCGHENKQTLSGIQDFF
jgi:DNA-directed RNA polymerase subunit M/transcription elongation factor TFIIS